MPTVWARLGLGAETVLAGPLLQGAPQRAVERVGHASRKCLHRRDCEQPSGCGQHSRLGHTHTLWARAAPASGRSARGRGLGRDRGWHFELKHSWDTAPFIPGLLWVQQPARPARARCWLPLGTRQRPCPEARHPDLEPPTPRSTLRSRSGSSPSGRCGSTSPSCAAPWSTCIPAA